MDKFQHFGRLSFAISIAFFGAQYLLYDRFVPLAVSGGSFLLASTLARKAPRIVP